jgi:hypothetical protein
MYKGVYPFGVLDLQIRALQYRPVHNDVKEVFLNICLSEGRRRQFKN